MERSEHKFIGRTYPHTNLTTEFVSNEIVYIGIKFYKINSLISQVGVGVKFALMTYVATATSSAP